MQLNHFDLKFKCHCVVCIVYTLKYTTCNSSPSFSIFFYHFHIPFTICSLRPTRIDIELENANGVFMAGQMITGKVLLELIKPTEALGINIYASIFQSINIYFSHPFKYSFVNLLLHSLDFS